MSRFVLTDGCRESLEECAVRGRERIVKTNNPEAGGWAMGGSQKTWWEFEEATLKVAATGIGCGVGKEGLP
jgi:hypothetical protein